MQNRQTNCAGLGQQFDRAADRPAGMDADDPPATARTLRKDCSKNALLHEQALPKPDGAV